MALMDALREWEAQWRAAGGPIDEGLAPGLSEAEVRAVIDWIEPHPDLLTWFRWHGGIAAGLLFETANPRHNHELEAFVEHRTKVGNDKILIPGVIDSTTNFIEHPRVVANRLRGFVDLAVARLRADKALQ